MDLIAFFHNGSAYVYQAFDGESGFALSNITIPDYASDVAAQRGALSSSDGTLLAVGDSGSSSSSLLLYDLTTIPATEIPTGNSKSGNSDRTHFAFNPVNNSLAIVRENELGSGDEFTVLDATNGYSEIELGETERGTGASWSRDGAILAITSSTGEYLYAFDANNSFAPLNVLTLASPARAIAFHPALDVCVIAHDGKLNIYDCSGPSWSLLDDSFSIGDRSVAFNQDGSLLAISAITTNGLIVIDSSDVDPINWTRAYSDSVVAYPKANSYNWDGQKLSVIEFISFETFIEVYDFSNLGSITSHRFEIEQAQSIFGAPFLATAVRPTVDKYVVITRAHEEIYCFDVEHDFSPEQTNYVDNGNNVGIVDPSKDGKLLAFRYSGVGLSVPSDFFRLFDASKGVNNLVEVSTGFDLAAVLQKTTFNENGDVAVMRQAGNVFVLDASDSYARVNLPVGLGSAGDIFDIEWNSSLSHLVVATEFGDRLYVFDVSTKPFVQLASPTVSPSDTYSNYCVEYLEQRNLLLVLTDQLRAYDTSTIPYTLLGSCACSANLNLQASYDETLVACSNNTNGLQIIDISDPDPANWVLKEQILGSGTTASFWFRDTNKLIFGRRIEQELYQVDCTDPDNISYQLIELDNPEAFGSSSQWRPVLVAGPSSDDETPDAFSFADVVDAEVSTHYEQSVTVSGINESVPVFIETTDTAQYKINSGSYVDTVSWLDNGDTLFVRLQSSAVEEQTTSVVVHIGSESATFQVTTETIDNIPDVFSFEDVTDAELDQEYSSSVSVSGIEIATSITVTGLGEYSVNGGVRTSDPGTVTNGDSVTVYLTSSDSYFTTVESTLTIGGVSDTFSITTLYSNEEAFMLGEVYLNPYKKNNPANLVVLKDNTMELFLSNLRSGPSETPVVDATVGATITDANSDPVSGASPLTLSYIDESGDYSAIIEDHAAFNVGEQYLLIVTATTPGGAQASWKNILTVSERNSENESLLVYKT
ncbi:hypothetical protein TDB9533_01242 [Thalassocella blandensis]|nr:hypothetical protein TDB9533_01242 [Thalassocella blandensis]